MQQNEVTVRPAKSSFSIGLLAALSAITMLFAAFTSAYVVRRGLGNDWAPLSLPGILFITPVLLICGSISLEIGWKYRKKFFRSCFAAATFGTLFLAAQFFGWMNLGDGVRISTQPAAAFYYIFSGLFCLFVWCGVVASIRSGLQGAGGALQSKNIIYYWHYLSLLWLYLLGLLYWGN
jgi:cytochrome c oxidase subunit III